MLERILLAVGNVHGGLMKVPIGAGTAVAGRWRRGGRDLSLTDNALGFCWGSWRGFGLLGFVCATANSRRIAGAIGTGVAQGWDLQDGRSTGSRLASIHAVVTAVAGTITAMNAMLLLWCSVLAVVSNEGLGLVQFLNLLAKIGETSSKQSVRVGTRVVSIIDFGESPSRKIRQEGVYRGTAKVLWEDKLSQGIPTDNAPCFSMRAPFQDSLFGRRW
mmetsp:Transcript_5832/g.16371  ORF Transcript_5832/g.16371 Transcript_5832/m.16371 type:complete len:217 (+) Transcript_5832:279-929(+)